MSVELAREVADAVLYEGYLLYPYRASSSKNQSRWQFGVLGPPRASADSFAEQPRMSMQCLVEPGDAAGAPSPRVTVRLRFLQVQDRTVQQLVAGGGTGPRYAAVERLVVGGRTWLSWQEATEHEIVLPAYDLLHLLELRTAPEARVEVPG